MKILCVVPPIYDFSAYDLWSKPLGFLKIIDVLKKNGIEVLYFDFLDRNHSFYENKKNFKKNKFGCGKYYHQIINKPELYKNVPRKYKRFGLPKELFLKFLENNRKIDFVFISSGMTYWFLGLIEIKELIKKILNKVPVIIGGVYATFCEEHAKNQGFDYIFKGKDIKKFFWEFSNNFKLKLKIPKRIEFDWSVYKKVDYMVVKTSYGCPFSCWYCGIKKLDPTFIKRDINEVVEELEKNIETFKINDIAFYDDALLFDFEKHLYKIICKLNYNNLRFHTPNGIHPKFINKEVAYFLKEANFKTLRLSLETIDEKRKKESNFKVEFFEFEKAVKNLIDAGFTKEEIGVYIMAGLPLQTPEDVKKAIEILKNYPVKIKIAEYSPIPGTLDFEISKTLYPDLPLDNPLFQNNSIYPLWNFENKWEIINELKLLAKS